MLMTMIVRAVLMTARRVVVDVIWGPMNVVGAVMIVPMSRPGYMVVAVPTRPMFMIAPTADRRPVARSRDITCGARRAVVRFSTCVHAQMISKRGSRANPPPPGVTLPTTERT